MGQVPDAELLLVFDHISQNKTKRVFLHHLVESILVERRKIRGEEETGSGILSEYVDPSHLEHFLHRSKVFCGGSLDGFNLLGQGSDFLLEGPDLP